MFLRPPGWLFATFLSAVVATIAVQSAAGQQSASPRREPADRPNVVLIVADDLGYADVGCYGGKEIRTPQLDELAKEGTRFTSFYVAQAVCTASRAGLLSGCYPNRIGMAGALNHTSTVGIHPDEYLLSEMFRDLGYATACFGKWHLGTKPEFFPTRNGFVHWIGLPYSNDNGPLHPTVKGIPPLPFYSKDKVIHLNPNQALFTSQFTEYGAGFITAYKDQPFFLYLPHVMPHVPIFAKEKPADDSPRGLYKQVVEELDSSVGEILQTLKKLDLERNTIVIFMSDNGPFLSYGDHAGRAEPFREGKLTTFDGGLRVPFIVRWPEKIPAARTSDALLSGLDLLPSLASIVGGKLPGERKIDGVDLSPLLLGGKDAKERASFACYSGSELHAVRRGKWKLHVPHDYLTVDGPPGTNGKPANFGNMKPNPIEQSGIRGIASRHGYRVEKIELSLFDLSADPGEAKNVAAEHPEIVAELQQLIADFRRDLGDSLTQTKGSGLRPAGEAK